MIPIILVSLLTTPNPIPLHNCDKIIFYEVQIAETQNGTGLLCVEIKPYPDKREFPSEK